MKSSIQAAARVAVITLGLLIGGARADQKLGVDVYPGAEFLPGWSAQVNAKSGGVDASCYRTGDGVEAVKAFYARSPGFAPYEGNVMRRGKVDVVIHPPAVDPKTGAVSPYTVFCIMQATG